MQKFKTLATSHVAVIFGGTVLVLLLAWPFVGNAQDKSGKAKDPDPHAQHQDKQPPGDHNLAGQIAELHAKVAKLEAALEKSHASGMTGRKDKPSGGMGPMGNKGGTKLGMGGMDGSEKKMDGIGADKKLAGGLGMMDMGKEKGMAAMEGDKAGMMDQQMMQMMEMMQQMMQMKMAMMGKGMGSGTPDMKGMQTPGMKGMEMGKKGMKMGVKGMEMMGGKAMAAMQSPAALPAFPGVSHIYHIGSTGFFLDHPEDIKLTTEQQTALNQAKEKSLLEQASFQRKIDDAEQETGTLTSSDKPDATKIDAKVREIEKIRGDQRLAFIRAVGEAATVLTDEQRKSLFATGADKPGAHAGH